MVALLFVGGLPGGTELLVVFFIMVLFVLVPLAAVGALAYLLLRRRSSPDADRIAELESEVRRLRERVEELEG